MSELAGRRYPDNTAPAQSNVSDGMEPGGYALHDWTDPPHWQIRDPFGKCASISLSQHSVVVHDDDTITVNPSIFDTTEGGFHGWLKQGMWSW